MAEYRSNNRVIKSSFGETYSKQNPGGKSQLKESANITSQVAILVCKLIGIHSVAHTVASFSKYFVLGFLWLSESPSIEINSVRPLNYCLPFH